MRESALSRAHRLGEFFRSARERWEKRDRPSVLHMLYLHPAVAGKISRHFHRVYYYRFRATLGDMSWMGVPLIKVPTDMWVYQEILLEVRPRLIVESGTFRGGSALFMASILDLLGDGEVLTIDVEPRPDRPSHDRITYIEGSSASPQTLDRVRDAIREPVLVVLDSDHGRDHVLAELRAYADLVTPGSYLVVEDTNVNGNPVLPRWGPGPAEAVEQFLAERDDYVVDRSREKFLLTMNPGGWLRRLG